MNIHLEHIVSNICNVAHQVWPRYFFLVILAAIVTYRLPVFRNFLRTIYTFFHESGHALTTLLLGGRIYHIKIHYNLEGTTLTESRNKFTLFLISISGYVFASVVSYMGFFSISTQTPLLFLVGFIILLAFHLILHIRNGFGIVWSIIFLALNGFLILYTPCVACPYVCFLSTIMLVESVIASGFIFILGIRQPAQAGDASVLAKFTRIPAWFWGLFFLVQSIFWAYHSVNILLHSYHVSIPSMNSII